MLGHHQRVVLEHVVLAVRQVELRVAAEDAVVAAPGRGDHLVERPGGPLLARPQPLLVPDHGLHVQVAAGDVGAHLCVHGAEGIDVARRGTVAPGHHVVRRRVAGDGVAQPGLPGLRPRAAAAPGGPPGGRWSCPSPWRTPAPPRSRASARAPRRPRRTPTSARGPRRRRSASSKSARPMPRRRCPASTLTSRLARWSLPCSQNPRSADPDGAAVGARGQQLAPEEGPRRPGGAAQELQVRTIASGRSCRIASCSASQ